MEAITRDDLKQAGIDFVAAYTVLMRRSGRSEPVIDFARKSHSRAVDILQQNGFAPHLAEGLDSIKRGEVSNVRIYGAPGVEPVDVNGVEAARISSILYPH